MRTKISILTFLVLLITGCVTAPQIKELQEETRTMTREYNDLIEQMRERSASQKVPDHVVVESDEYQTLLDSNLSASYDELDVRDALKQVVVGYPIVFDIPEDYRVNVSASPRAVTVRDHIDSISVQSNLGIRLMDGVVIVSTSITREFDIPAFGNANQQSTGATYSVTSNNLNSLAGGGGGFSNVSQYRFNIYEELTGLIKSITGLTQCETGGLTIQPGVPAPPTAFASPNQTDCYSISGSANLLTLTSRPRAMAEFSLAFDDWITSINRSAEVSLKIVELDVTDTTQQSFDFSLVRNASVITTLDATSNGLVNINDGAGVLRFNFQEGNRWDGSQIIIEALSAVGEVASVQTKEFQVLNNRLLTIKNFTNERFVEEITIQDTAQGGTSLSTPTIKQGEIPVGQAVNVLPTITESGISMHIVYNDATLDRLVPFEVGDQITGITPIDSGSDNVFDVTLNDGETVMLASSHRKEITVQEENPAAVPRLHITKTQGGEKRITQTLFIISARLI